jgi:flagellin-like hook-associated protein FlgL
MEARQTLENLLEKIKEKQQRLTIVEKRLEKMRVLAQKAANPEILDAERREIQKTLDKLLEEVRLLEAEATRYQ